MTVIEFVLALTVILIVVTGWCVGIWHTIHHFRRKHRLQREEDERAHRRALASDFAEATKQLTEGVINFSDYAGSEKSEVGKKITAN